MTRIHTFKPIKMAPWLAIAAIAAGCGRSPAPTAAPLLPVDGTIIPHQIIVKYHTPNGRSVQDIAPIRPSVEGAIHAEAVTFDAAEDVQLVRLPETGDDAAAIARYRANPRVEWVMPNYHVDVTTERLAQAAATPGWHLDRIGARAAWGHATGKGVVVAVLDSGIDYNHPSLAGQIVKGPDYAEFDNDPKDKFGHGTHVAGIIAARPSGAFQLSGVAPEAQVLDIEVLGANGGGSIFNIAKGIKYAADYGKKHHVHVVINLSLGGGAYWDPINLLAGKYAKSQGALLVAAAGNSNGPVGTPARLGDFMAIAASDSSDHRAHFSCFGPQVALAAPGVAIMSTTPTYHVPLNDMRDAQGQPVAEGAASLQGTSMATPVVSGVAALVWSDHADWTAAQVRERLETTAQHPGGGGRDQAFGFGVVNAAAAVD